MNKQEILEEISKAEEHIANMKKMLVKREYERWKPEINEPYYYINHICGVVQDRNDNTDIDTERYNFYNCFQTREQAKAEVEKILVRRQLEDIARRLNKDEKIDWNNQEREKHCLAYDNNDKCICQAVNKFTIRQGTVYCLDENFKDIAIQEIGKEQLTKYLRGE